VANQICDGITSAAVVDQSQSPDDVALATTEVPIATTPNAPPSTPAALDSAENSDDIIPTSLPDEDADENGVVITPEEMAMAELKVKVVCQEKANMALRMELKCAELQVTNERHKLLH